MSRHPYSDANISFATMHEKEKVLGPLFKKRLDASLFVPEDIDTDLYGTFSGEVQRKPDIKAVLRRKAKDGMQRFGLKYGIASEDSFQSHPKVPFLNDLLVFIFSFLEKFEHPIKRKSKPGRVNDFVYLINCCKLN